MYEELGTLPETDLSVNTKRVVFDFKTGRLFGNDSGAELTNMLYNELAPYAMDVVVTDDPASTYLKHVSLTPLYVMPLSGWKVALDTAWKNIGYNMTRLVDFYYGSQSTIEQPSIIKVLSTPVANIKTHYKDELAALSRAGSSSWNFAGTVAKYVRTVAIAGAVIAVAVYAYPVFKRFTTKSNPQPVRRRRR